MTRWKILTPLGIFKVPRCRVSCDKHASFSYQRASEAFVAIKRSMKIQCIDLRDNYGQGKVHLSILGLGQGDDDCAHVHYSLSWATLNTWHISENSTTRAVLYESPQIMYSLSQTINMSYWLQFWPNILWQNINPWYRMLYNAMYSNNRQTDPFRLFNCLRLATIPLTPQKASGVDSGAGVYCYGSHHVTRSPVDWSVHRDGPICLCVFASAK